MTQRVESEDERAAEEWAASTEAAMVLLKEARNASAPHPSMRPYLMCDHAIKILDRDYRGWLDGGDGGRPVESARALLRAKAEGQS